MSKCTLLYCCYGKLGAGHPRPLDSTIDEILNGYGAHLTGYDLAPEADLETAKDRIKALLVKARQDELVRTCLAGIPELTPRQQSFIQQRLAELEGK